MAYFTYDDKNIYYEEHGEGTPLVVLNGIMMSCGSWAQFISPLSASNRLILVDFLDQGRSSRMDCEYTQDIQVEVVNQLLKHLSLDCVNIMGISYGGEVAQLFSATYPEKVSRLMLFNTTARTGPWLGAIGDGWNLSASDPDAYYLTTIPIIYSPSFYTKQHKWMEERRELLRPVFANPLFIDAMKRLTNSAVTYDVISRLPLITAETLVVSAELDFLTPMAEQRLIADGIKNSHYVIMPNCGHASMYEVPMLFTSLVLGFTNVNTIDFHII